MAKRRFIYVKNLLEHLFRPSGRVVTGVMNEGGGTLKPGDMVRVRSKPEIQATLNNWNTLKGCAMMEEMWKYCDSRQTVLKRVERFLDERDYLVKRTSGLIILDGVICNGTIDFGPCDRSCFFFWREEWLEIIPDNTGSPPGTGQYSSSR